MFAYIDALFFQITFAELDMIVYICRIPSSARIYLYIQ